MKSIKTELILVMCAIMGTIFCFQIGANYVLGERYYVSGKKKEISAVYEKLKVAGAEEEQLLSIMETAEEEMHLQFILANEEKKQVYNSRKKELKTWIDFKKDADLFLEDAKPVVVEGKGMTRVRLSGIIQTEDSFYYVYITTASKLIKDDVKRTNMFILYIGGIALLAGVLVIYFVADRITRPIEEISQVAVQVSKMDFSMRSGHDNRGDEIGSLSRNINFMAGRLEKNITGLKEFIANISHELKTPLAVLTGYTEMLKKDIPGIDKEFYLEVILDETQRLNDMVKRLIDLSCMENQLVNLQKEEVNVRELLEYLVRKNEMLFAKKDIILETNIETDARVYGDAGYLEQAISDYLNNAMEHTKAGDRVILSAWQSRWEVTISVYNQGEGIPEEKLNPIWDSFYRTNEARSRTEYSNMGLGLYIVKMIADAHQGKCSVANCEEGVEFFLTIPRKGN